MWKPGRAKDFLTVEILVKEPSGCSYSAFVVDDDVKSCDGRLVVVFKEVEDEAETGEESVSFCSVRGWVKSENGSSASCESLGLDCAEDPGKDSGFVCY